MANLQEDLSRIGKQLMFSEPFYGIFMSTLNKVVRKDLPTAGVSKNNINYQLAINEEFWNSLDNGHAKKGEEFRNDMTNFGILMEIKGIENPFEWSREVVNKLQFRNIGLYYSPSRTPSQTSEGESINTVQVGNLNQFKEVMGEYADYIINFIDQMNKVFEFKNDWGMYIPEVKYLSPEPLVDYKNLALIDYPNVHFVGDALSARGITVSGAQGIYVAESLL